MHKVVEHLLKLTEDDKIAWVLRPDGFHTVIDGVEVIIERAGLIIIDGIAMGFDGIGELEQVAQRNAVESSEARIEAACTKMLEA